MYTLQKCTRITLAVAYRVSLLLPVQRIPWLTTCCRVGWSAWLCYTAYLVLSWRVYGVDTSVGGLVGTALFMCNTLSALMIAFEAMLKQRAHCNLQKLLRTVDGLLVNCLDMGAQPAGPMRCILPALLTDAVCVAAQICIAHYVYASQVFWWSLPVIQVIRLRFVQVAVVTIELNQRARLLKRALQKLASHNKRKSKYGFDVWRPYTSWEWEQLNVSRLTYGYLHRAYAYVDDCFGYSLVMMLLTTFFTFVCNLFWCFDILRNECLSWKFIYNLTTMYTISLVVVLLLGSADASEIYSHHIGCMICKLVKPLGNKRYNDLVTHFSLQTLHQRFVITAKSFFNLNMNLLGGMVAAIVTYLVILIQFMFAEKVSTGAHLTTPMPTNSSTPATVGASKMATTATVIA